MRKKSRVNKEYIESDQRAISILKSDSEEAAYRRAKENEFNPLELVKDIIGFVFVVGIAFGWMILMLLILSFVSLSYTLLGDDCISGNRLKNELARRNSNVGVIFVS